MPQTDKQIVAKLKRSPTTVPPVDHRSAARKVLCDIAENEANHVIDRISAATALLTFDL